MLQSIQSYVSQLLRQLNREYIGRWQCYVATYYIKIGASIWTHPQIERTYKKMNEYLIEMELSTEDNLSDEEIMIEVSNRKLHINRKKKQKENNIYGKESNYNLYC